MKIINIIFTFIPSAALVISMMKDYGKLQEAFTVDSHLIIMAAIIMGGFTLWGYKFWRLSAETESKESEQSQKIMQWLEENADPQYIYEASTASDAQPIPVTRLPGYVKFDFSDRSIKEIIMKAKKEKCPHCEKR